MGCVEEQACSCQRLITLCCMLLSRRPVSSYACAWHASPSSPSYASYASCPFCVSCLACCSCWRPVLPMPPQCCLHAVDLHAEQVIAPWGPWRMKLHDSPQNLMQQVLSCSSLSASSIADKHTSSPQLTNTSCGMHSNVTALFTHNAAAPIPLWNVTA